MQSQEDPEVRPGSFVTIDAALLVQQNLRLDKLNQNILMLSQSVSSRPTRAELETQRRHDLIRRMALIALAVLIAVGFYFQQKQIRNEAVHDRNIFYLNCLDRNELNSEFVVLLESVVELTSDAESRARLDKVFSDYISNLEPIDCQNLLSD